MKKATPATATAETTKETPRQERLRLLKEGLGVPIFPKKVIPRLERTSMATHCLRESCEILVSNGSLKK
ncbi:MAG: hypothetical protein PHO90_00540 [Candidatus Pacebacteria bacterium]|nr:hypothetical protein [Candidatus Paceibacterota bacterium]